MPRIQNLDAKDSKFNLPLHHLHHLHPPPHPLQKIQRTQEHRWIITDIGVIDIKIEVGHPKKNLFQNYWLLHKLDRITYFNITRRPYRVNKFAIGSMIFENRKTNERMDRLEVDRANNELQKIDKTGRQA